MGFGNLASLSSLGSLSSGGKVASIVESDAQAYWKADQKSGDYLVDLTGNGHDARFGSVGAARVINKGRAKYLRLPGTSGNYASTPDAAPLDITGDITIDVRLALVDWTPASVTDLLAKWDGNGNQKSYFIRITTGGIIQLFTSNNGAATVGPIASTVATGITDGTVKWLRVSVDVNDGAGNSVVKFYLSDDGENWTQLGDTVTTAGAITIFNSTAPLELGSVNIGAANFMTGKYYRAKIYNSYLQASAGTPVFNADFTNLSDGATSFTESSSNAATVTINSTSPADTNDPTYLEYTGAKYAYLPGVVGNYISAPDSAALSVTGDIDIRIQVSMDDWTPSAENTLVSKFKASPNLSYIFSLQAAGTLRFYISSNGTSLAGNVNSGTAVGATDGEIQWVRVAWRASDGRTQFFKSSNGTTWTQVGANQTLAAGSIFDGADALNIGSHNDGATQISTGKFYRCVIYSDLTETTKVFDWNVNNATAPYATMTEDSSNAATVTFNRSATGKKLAVVDRTLALFGTDDYLEVQNQSNLNFGASDSFTLVAVLRIYGSPINNQILSKKDTLSGFDAGYYIGISGGSDALFRISDAAIVPVDTFGTTDVTPGVVVSVSGVRDTVADTIEAFLDATTNGPGTDTTTGTLSNTLPLRIGATSGTAGSYLDGEIIGLALFRKALTPTQRAQVKTELGG